MAEGNDGGDDNEKTEQPSERKLEKALEKGQVVTSREISSFFILFAFTLLFIWILPDATKKSVTFIRSIVENAGTIRLDSNTLSLIMMQSLSKTLFFLIPILFLAVFVSVFSAFAQRGKFVFSAHQIMPDLSRISPFQGLKKMFSTRSVVELIKGLIKVFVVGLFIYIFVMIDIKDLRLYPQMSIGAINNKIYHIISNIFICVSITSAAIAALDYGYQQYKHIESLKMTKHEVKEEYKETEGNPQIKRKQRSIQMSIANKRMMAAVPQADVVITNPEHYAIALRYDHTTMAAPKVVAKGIDEIAQKIKQIARENEVTIFEDPPLARMLYKDTNIDKFIPLEHYQAVARIISYVYKIKKRSI